MGNLQERPVVAMLNDDDYEDGDNEDFWKQVESHLTLYHCYKVKFFRDDREFLKFVLASGAKVDAAVIDFRLTFFGPPESSSGPRELLGTSVLDEIRESSTLPSSFPVIMMTNKFEYENEILCYRHNASAVMAKFELRPGRGEKFYQASGFANKLHAILTLLGVGTGSGTGSGTPRRYLHFRNGWMFDSETKKLTDPSNVVVPLTWRGTIILERFLAHPGQVLTPKALGVETGRSENIVLSGSVHQCCAAIHKHAQSNQATARALEEYVEEFRAGKTDQASADDAVRWLARLTIADPVFDVIIPAVQAGASHSEQVSAAELQNHFASSGRAAPDADGRKEIIAGFVRACRRCGAARKVIGSLDRKVIEAATKPLEEFYGSVHAMAGKLDPGHRDQMIDGLYGRFFRHLFPDLPEPKGDQESGFTLKNLRQRVIPDLRRALGDTDRSQPLISNVHNEGYCFEATVEDSDSDRNRSWWAWSR